MACRHQSRVTTHTVACPHTRSASPSPTRCPSTKRSQCRANTKCSAIRRRGLKRSGKSQISGKLKKIFSPDRKVYDLEFRNPCPCCREKGPGASQYIKRLSKKLARLFKNKKKRKRLGRGSTGSKNCCVCCRCRGYRGC